jgi:hypothetical protein
VACSSIGRWEAVEGARPFLLGSQASGPNAADFALSCLAGRLSASGQYDDIAVLTGDGGFAALLRALALLGSSTTAVVPSRGGRIPARLAGAAPVVLVIPEGKEADAEQAAPVQVISEGLDPQQVEAVAAVLSGPSREWVALPRLATELAKRGMSGLRGKLASYCRAAAALETEMLGGVIVVRPAAIAG